MLDGELEVGYTPVFLFFLFVLVILYLRKPTVYLLGPLARLASNPPITRFSELIFLLLLYIAELPYR